MQEVQYERSVEVEFSVIFILLELLFSLKLHSLLCLHTSYIAENTKPVFYISVIWYDSMSESEVLPFPHALLVDM